MGKYGCYLLGAGTLKSALLKNKMMNLLSKENFVFLEIQKQYIF